MKRKPDMPYLVCGIAILHVGQWVLLMQPSTDRVGCFKEPQLSQSNTGDFQACSLEQQHKNNVKGYQVFMSLHTMQEIQTYPEYLFSGINYFYYGR